MEALLHDWRHCYMTRRQCMYRVQELCALCMTPVNMYVCGVLEEHVYVCVYSRVCVCVFERVSFMPLASST